MAEIGDVHIIVTDVNGRILENVTIAHQYSGANTTRLRLDNQPWNGIYFLTVRTRNFETTRKIISQGLN